MPDNLDLIISGIAAAIGLALMIPGKPKHIPMAEDFYSTVTVQEFHERQQVQKWWRP